MKKIFNPKIKILYKNINMFFIKNIMKRQFIFYDPTSIS